MKLLGPPPTPGFPQPTYPKVSWPHLKNSEQCLGEGVKGASLGLGLVKVELSPKQLHAKQGEDDDKEEEEKQQGCNRFHGIEQGCHQIAQRCPVPVEGTERGRVDAMSTEESGARAGLQLGVHWGHLVEMILEMWCGESKK